MFVVWSTCIGEFVEYMYRGIFVHVFVAQYFMPMLNYGVQCYTDVSANLPLSFICTALA